MRNLQTVLAVFQAFLQHDDSYVFLTAINGLAAIGDTFPDETLPLLIGEYSLVYDRLNIITHVVHSNATHPVDVRLKMGDVMLKVVQHTGQVSERCCKHYSRYHANRWRLNMRG